MEPAPPETLINTPVQLDLAARAAERVIERHSSPLRRFAIFTDFFRRCEHLPDAWTASYHRTMYPALSICIRHEYVCWTNPDEWLLVLRILHRLKTAAWIHEEDGFGETEAVALEKCCATLACVGAFREMHQTLQSCGWAAVDISHDAWIGVFNADTLGKDAFREYVAALAVHDLIPPFLEKAMRRLHQAREDAKSPGVLLVDDSMTFATAPALVLFPECVSSRSSEWRMQFNNAVAEENTATHRQLAQAVAAARGIVEHRFGATLHPQRLTLRFHEHDASYTGESMGLAVALQLLELLQSDFNRHVRWKIQPGLCCTGAVDDAGRVHPLPEESLKPKIIAAFFSPANALVLHAAHLESARGGIRDLQTRWPSRRLEVYGVTALEDCLSASGIVQVLHRTPYDRAAEYLNKHATPLLLIAVLLLVVAAGYFWWKSAYGYPDLEYASGEPIRGNALVYNPRRAADWQFRDYATVRQALLPFGDLEIGADATRNIWLWNMTPARLDVLLSVEGPQADQWYISWNGGSQSINATDSLRVMLKYVPTREGSGNEAILAVRDPGSGELLTSLALRGSAGPPLASGYALLFDGVDDLLHFGEDAIAFTRDEGTLEFWFRPDTTTCCIFSNNRNVPDGPAMQNMTLSLVNGVISCQVGNNNSVADPGGGQRIKLGTWHHLALTFSRKNRSIRLLLDGEIILDKSEEFIIAYYMRPFVTFGAYHNQESIQAPFRGALDEIRVWDSALPPEVIRARMNKKVSGLADGLLGYWDFDVVAEVSAHNANERTQDGLLLHRPSYIRSAAPLEITTEADILLVRGPDGKPAAELQPMRWLQCGSDPIQGSAQRSYAIRFRSPREMQGVVFTVMNQDAHLRVLHAAGEVRGEENFLLPVRSSWNSVVVRVDEHHTAEFFLNGKSVYTSSSEHLTRGPGYRYEGLHVGIFNDKYNNFGTQYYDGCRPMLLRKLAVRDFSVWQKHLTMAEVQAIEHGDLPRDRLAAHWPLDGLPDARNNYTDTIGGHLLHLWRYFGWL